MSKTDYDCIYYWVGGTEVGEWRKTFVNEWQIWSALERMSRCGLIARPGREDTGPPEGPPYIQSLRK